MSEIMRNESVLKPCSHSLKVGKVKQQLTCWRELKSSKHACAMQKCFGEGRKSFT